MPAVPEGRNAPGGARRKRVENVYLPGDTPGWYFPLGPDNNWACDNRMCEHNLCLSQPCRITDRILKMMREIKNEPYL